MTQDFWQTFSSFDYQLITILIDSHWRN